MIPEKYKPLADAGILSPWILYPQQKKVYLHQSEHRFPFCEMNRRFGKTFTTYLRLHEILSREPNWAARWCEPWKNQCREILQPEINKILAWLPPAQHPKWIQTDSYYLFPNGSRLYLRGINEDKAESARGSFSHVIVCDEFGSYRDSEYVINEVLLPQLLTTNGQLIIIGTPPKNLAHPYYRYKEKAISEGRFIQKTIDECDWFDPEQKASMCEAVGGKESSAWKREFLCEPVADSESLVLPEFNEKLHVFDEIKMPEKLDWYVSMDAGFHDHTAVLFGYVDFLKGQLVIMDEVWVRGKNSEEIANEIKGKLTHTAYRMIADAPSQQIHDLRSLHNLPFDKPLKDDRFAAINAMRVLFSQNRVLINRKCSHLIYQCKVGMWNDARKDFERGEGIGHLDSIAALIYLCRTVDWYKNPFPRLAENVNESDYWINEEAKQDLGLGRALFPFRKGI